jgi:hypothetical protein
MREVYSNIEELNTLGDRIGVFLFIFIYFISLSINPVESIQSLADVEIVLVTVTIKIQFAIQ